MGSQHVLSLPAPGTWMAPRRVVNNGQNWGKEGRTAGAKTEEQVRRRVIQLGPSGHEGSDSYCCYYC